MTDTAPRHFFDDHVGEVRMRVEAPTLVGLFEEAARGLSELMLEKAGQGDDASPESVTVLARDPESLLVAWLNELVFLSEVRHRVYNDVQVRRVSETKVEADIRGVFPESIRTAVKAATMHELSVTSGPEGYAATVVLDV